MRRWMHRGLWASVAAALAALAVPAGSSVAAVRGRAVRATAAQAYVYGLAAIDELRVLDRLPVNLLASVTNLSDPSQRLVPAPNVDTLYTVARLELAAAPLVVHVPNEHGRYYTLQFLDAYTNSFAYIGRRVTGTGPGDYAIIAPGWHGALPVGVHPIHAPTATVWLLGRTLVRGPSDLAAANAIQHGYTLTPLRQFGGAPLPALFVPRSTLTPLPAPRGLAFYDALDSDLANNPPPQGERALLRRFAAVGIAPGRSVSQQHLSGSSRRALLAGLRLGAAEVARYGRRLLVSSARRHNGWLVPPAATGRFGTNYLLRAYVAQTALGANVPAEALYPFALTDDGLRPLTGAHRYVLRFSARDLPPVNAFWSLTMYDRSRFLVPNPIDRYAIGDRTPGLRRGRDGSLTILIQHTRPRSGSANWLPAPASRFILALRLYQPRRSVLRGRWPPPRIIRVG